MSGDPSAAILAAIGTQRRAMVNRLNRLDFGNVGLAVLTGAAVSMGFIQLLAGPLEQVANLSVQVLSIRTTALVAPVLISLLLLLRDGPLMVKLGARFAHRRASWLRQVWRQQSVGLIFGALAHLPYMLAAALVAAMLTRPELDSLDELRFLVGNLDPLLLGFSLLKTALFAGLTLWIALDQGARARRLGLPPTAGLSRAISVSLAVVLMLDLFWALLITPLISIGVS
jgi:hypothetical protein